jgi:hypothetical protein
VRERESELQAAARQDPAVRARDSRQRTVAWGKKTHEMAHGVQVHKWGVLIHCVHSCGCIHLSNSTPGTRKKCCINGHISSASDNFDEELMMGYVLDELPSFVRIVILSSGTTFLHDLQYRLYHSVAYPIGCAFYLEEEYSYEN